MTNAKRRIVWERLGTDLKPKHPDTIVTNEIGLDGLSGAFGAYIDSQVTGRTLVRVIELTGASCRRAPTLWFPHLSSGASARYLV